MFEGLRIEMLLSDGFGGFGGISQFNRDFLTALGQSNLVERIYALPRVIVSTVADFMPEAVIFDRKAAGSKLRFVSRLLLSVASNRRSNLVICGHLNLLPAAYILARLRGARLALIIHGIEAWSPTRSWLTNKMVRRVDNFIAVSQFTAQRFAAWSGVPAGRGFILHNCVDMLRFRPSSRDLDLAKRYDVAAKRVLLTVGRLASEERYKGFDEVIGVMPELLERHPDLVYLIVGDGADRERLVEKVRLSGLSDSVIFAGRISEQEKVAHYNLADVYVMPSSGEGFGIVLLEAAACGLRIVGSIVDGSREALLDGKLGTIVDPRDNAAIVLAIGEALTPPNPHERLPALETFSVDNYRARVRTWALEQIDAIRGPDFRAVPIVSEHAAAE